MKKYLPILGWLPDYKSKWFRADLIAGLTIMALLVPEGMAYAELAGVPPQAAFYAAPIGLLAYAIFGSSRQLVVAVSSGIAVMSASIVGELAPADSAEFVSLTAALAVMAGVIAAVGGLLRLGRFARFFSPSVLTGFVSGLALLIIVKQLPKILGIEAAEGNSWERLADLFRSLPERHMTTLMVGVSTVVLMLILERWLNRVPAALVALVYGISVVSILGLESQGVHIVGEIPAGLAPPQIPDLEFAAVVALIPGALAIALVMFAEALGPARSFAAKHGYRIRDDQELIGLGMANLGAGLFQGFPIGASLSKSAASDAAGGKTQMAGVLAAIATALVALYLTPLFANLPEATLGAIVIVAVSPMVHVGVLRRLYRLRKLDFALATIALLGVLTFEDVLAGLLVAVIVSLLALISRASRPQISHLVRLPGTLNFRNAESHPEGLAITGLLILRPDEGLFFANAGPLHDLMRNSLDIEDGEVRTLLLDMSLTSETDVPGVAMLGALTVELDALDIELWLANVRSGLHGLMAESGVLETIGEANIHGDLAVAAVDFVRGSRGPVADSDIEAILERMSSLTDFMSRHQSVLSDAQRSELADLFHELERLSRPPH